MAAQQSPLWNQDAITAGGLAFAGMALLQSKLLPAVTVLDRWRPAYLDFIQRLTASPWFQWWPLLLIIAGVCVWIRAARQNRLRRRVRNVRASRSRFEGKLQGELQHEKR